MIKVLSLFLSFLITFNRLQAASSDIPAKRAFPIDEKINPCVSLYDYACTKVIESFELRADRKRHSFAFSDSAERILSFKKNYLLELIKNPSHDSLESEIRNFYLSCTNKETRAKEESVYIAEKLEKIAKISSKRDWFKLQAQRIHSGDPGFIHYYPVDNFDDPKKSDLVLATGYSFLPEKSYAENKELVTELELLIRNFFDSIHIDHATEKAKVVIGYELEHQRRRLFPAESRLAYSERSFISRTELLKKYSELNLKLFFKDVPKNIKIRVINRKSLPFLKSIAKIYTLEELKALQIFYELHSVLDFRYPDFYNKKFAFKQKFLGGKKMRSELSEECTEITMSKFGSEFDYLILPKMFPSFSSEKVAEMVDKIKKSILASLSKNTWLSPGAKKEAQKKIATAYMRLVAPAKYEDWKFLRVSEFNPESYLANIEKRNVISEAREFEYLKELKDIRSWEGVQPLQVNAFYEASYNQFTMLQGILQYPFYDQNNSEVENLAGIGMVVGHELGHGIDDQGAKYDSDGKLREWMTIKDLAKFKELTNSLVLQYSKAGMNGEYTLGENIGDLVGLTAAYDAAFNDKSLSGIELKKEQQKFFLSYARSYCEVQLPGVREYRLKSDPHSLGVARVNEVVKHFSGFQEAFGCKENDPMILPVEKRVHIW